MNPIVTKNAPAAIGPYSQGMRVGNLLFLSGQIPLDPKTMTVSGATIEEQTETVLLNISALLAAAGLSLKNVAKTTVFLKNMGDFVRFNEIYAKHFLQPYPARTTVEVSELPKQVLIEIETIAVFS
ncbi:MAG: RidA family protein [Deltaproteobacteria bacterium]|nr:RidA family protein [Deltaproteobacteria bacterium]MBI3294297.1 RidA family protein [Deltaproteobacteria bacterium]